MRGGPGAHRGTPSQHWPCTHRCTHLDAVAKGLVRCLARAAHKDPKGHANVLVAKNALLLAAVSAAQVLRQLGNLAKGILYCGHWRASRNVERGVKGESGDNNDFLPVFFA